MKKPRRSAPAATLVLSLMVIFTMTMGFDNDAELVQEQLRARSLYLVNRHNQINGLLATFEDDSAYFQLGKKQGLRIEVERGIPILYLGEEGKIVFLDARGRPTATINSETLSQLKRGLPPIDGLPELEPRSPFLNAPQANALFLTQQIVALRKTVDELVERVNALSQ